MNEEKAGKENFSAEDEEGRPLVFHYSREHRLSRASPMVRSLYDEKPARPGLRRMFATRGNSMLFLSIVITCGALFAMTSRFSGGARGIMLGGNSVTAAVHREGGSLSLDIHKNAPKTGEVYLGPVDIAVSPVMPKESGEAPAYFHRVFFNPEDSESFRISLPFEGKSFFVIFRTDEEMKSLKVQ